MSLTRPADTTPTDPTPSTLRITEPGQLRVIRRNGKLTPFDGLKISVAVTKAFLAVEGSQATGSSRVHEQVTELCTTIIDTLYRRNSGGGTVHIEDIQDLVELTLMRTGEHKVARSYVLYREEHARVRSEHTPADSSPTDSDSQMIQLVDGRQVPLDTQRLQHLVEEACAGNDGTDASRIVAETLRNLYQGMPERELNQSLLLAARSLIEQEPNYSNVSACLLMHHMRQEALGFVGVQAAVHNQNDLAKHYTSYFKAFIDKGIEVELLDERLRDYDLDRLGQALMAERDMQFTYLGLQTLYDRYFLHWDDTRFELPQAFFMRVAMGLALNESNREERAIEFYSLLSSFRFMSSTPTLFNAATRRSQLSSCYLTSVPDDLDGIYSALKDNAMLSKFAGGLGNDWTPVRAMGAHIKGTNGKSQGVVPFLKVANDTAVAVNQGGKRKGAVCAYLETWHLDIEEFLELRKNTGDERRRTHDMNTANWIPDLFMQRVQEDGDWTLFSPSDVPDLHDKIGPDFQTAYEAYEEQARNGGIKHHKTLPAVQLWRKMLGLLFETGHPWITFKDACNLRSPQRHAGVVHSSNLCTEITLNTSADEIAVCNLGSINLPAHLNEAGDLDVGLLRSTVRTAMRMLDNVIDINYYSVPQAKRSNMKHRPVGLGMMGFQDALHHKGLSYASRQAVEFADSSMEQISYFAIEASSDLAAERGSYTSYPGSLWSQGILPIDSLQLLQDYRGEQHLKVDHSSSLDWDSLRQTVSKQGMRNSNCMAIAPTATISNICGVTQSIEPTYQNLYVKSNLSGEFTVINPYLVDELKALDLWDSVMVNDLKYYDGSVQAINRIPDALKERYLCAFEMDSRWLIEAASRRQKWLDQGQSLNLYMAEPSGKKLNDLYMMAWIRGLKTTYYLRTMGATHAEKSTITDGTLNAVQRAPDAPKACAIDDPDCEACQ